MRGQDLDHQAAPFEGRGSFYPHHAPAFAGGMHALHASSGAGGFAWTIVKQITGIYPAWHVQRILHGTCV